MLETISMEHTTTGLVVEAQFKLSENFRLQLFMCFVAVSVVSVHVSVLCFNSLPLCLIKGCIYSGTWLLGPRLLCYLGFK